MKNLIRISPKALLLLAFVLSINISGLAQKKKTVRQTVRTKKAVKVAKQNKRSVVVYLNDGGGVSGKFVNASSKGIRVLILEKILTFDWKDIRTISFFEDPAGNYPAGNYPADGQMPTSPISEPVKPGEINRVPFEDLGDLVNSKVEKNEIDLGKPFMVVLDGAINADGKLDPKKSKFVKSEGDAQMVEVAKQALQALGDSGFLGSLKEKGIDKIELTLVQNDEEMYAILLSETKTPERAATAASMFMTFFQSAIFADKNGIKKLDYMSKVLFNNSKITSEDRNFRLDFKLPKQEAQDFIKQVLEKRAEKKKQQ